MKYDVVETSTRDLKKVLDEWSAAGWAVKEILTVPLAGAKLVVVFERSLVAA